MKWEVCNNAKKSTNGFNFLISSRIYEKIVSYLHRCDVMCEFSSSGDSFVKTSRDGKKKKIVNEFFSLKIENFPFSIIKFY